MTVRMHSWRAYVRFANKFRFDIELILDFSRHMPGLNGTGSHPPRYNIYEYEPNKFFNVFSSVNKAMNVICNTSELKELFSPIFEMASLMMVITEI